MIVLYVLMLVSGQGPTAVGIMGNGGNTLERCEARGRERVDELNSKALPAWQIPLDGGPAVAVEGAKPSWRAYCIPDSRGTNQ
jgi:hypothetical protein